jgi:hypothetical protein
MLRVYGWMAIGSSRRIVAVVPSCAVCPALPVPYKMRAPSTAEPKAWWGSGAVERPVWSCERALTQGLQASNWFWPHVAYDRRKVSAGPSTSGASMDALVPLQSAQVG